MRRRTSLIALTTIVLGSAATACSSDGTAAPSGDWRREDDGDLLVAIPKKWERSSPEEGAWTTRWTDPDNDSNVLMTIRSADEDDVYTALDTAADSARSVTRGYQLVG